MFILLEIYADNNDTLAIDSVLAISSDKQSLRNLSGGYELITEETLNSFSGCKLQGWEGRCIIQRTPLP